MCKRKRKILSCQKKTVPLHLFLRNRWQEEELPVMLREVCKTICS